ncbi:MAG: hypothetical protein ACFNX1_00655 [Treponema lecithinolyticum]|uniref:hypothetical protein n=1 Tax=Treponema lecithinolyticum TaxID=53418 RepID=UPI0036087F8D
MKKLKTLTAMTLLTLLVMQMSYTQSQTTSNKMPHMQFRLELGKAVYSKAELEKILNITLEETNKGIDVAFAAGYKQGLLAAAPDRDYYKTLADELQKEVNRLNTKVSAPWWTVPVCILGGAVVGFTIGYVRR